MTLHESLNSRADIIPLHEWARSLSGLPVFSWGAVSNADLQFLYDIIADTRPENFLEVGVATGFSSSFIGRFLELHGGKNYTGIDISDHFYGDPSLKLGFLVDQLLPNPSIVFDIRPKHTVFDVEGLLAGRKVDACFIDASHRHPHPLIDTILVLPWLADGAWMVHHDLALWEAQDPPYGTGPKCLFDCLRNDPTLTTDSRGRNIFGFRFSGRTDDYSAAFAECFRAPWTITRAMRRGEIRRIRLHMKRFYSDDLISAFEEAVDQNNRKFVVAPAGVTEG